MADPATTPARGDELSTHLAQKGAPRRIGV
jgi:hypothetical protein